MVGRRRPAAAAAAGGSGLILGDRQAQGHAGIITCVLLTYVYLVAYRLKSTGGRVVWCVW
jgi:hypothetical protein